MLVVGALYGLVWTIALAIVNYRKWVAKFRERLNEPRVRLARKIILGIAIILLAIVLLSSDILIKITLTTIVVLLVMGFYLYFFIKSIESVSMMKMIPVEKLTEGDWIVNDVVAGGKKICGPKDLGISKEQIAKLLKLKEKGKIEKVMVKEGIPFVPSFLAAFVLTYLFGLAPVTMLLFLGP
jgi:prepilin signal peptidase PulO-like enzyme (type II secretory pathway)